MYVHNCSLQFLSDIFNICVISMLASVDCLFLIQVEGFLFLVWVIFCYILNILCIFMKPCISFKSSVLAGFLWQHTGRTGGITPVSLGGRRSLGSSLRCHWQPQGRRPPHYCWAGVGIPAPHETCIDTTLAGAGLYLVTTPCMARAGTPVAGLPCPWAGTVVPAFHSAFSDTIPVGWK